MKNPAKRTYIKGGIWHLGGRKRQKGGVLPILGLPAKLLLESATSAVGGKILKELGSKVFGRGKRRLKRRRKRRIRRFKYA